MVHSLAVAESFFPSDCHSVLIVQVVREMQKMNLSSDHGRYRVQIRKLEGLVATTRGGYGAIKAALAVYYNLVDHPRVHASMTADASNEAHEYIKFGLQDADSMMYWRYRKLIKSCLLNTGCVCS